MATGASQKTSPSLNLSKFTTVWQDNFTQDQSFNSTLFPVRWGDASEFTLDSNGLTITSNGNAAGFETPDYLGPTSSYGYGLYQVTFTMPTNQAAGAYICLWPGTNQWPGPEIDLAEQLNGQPYLTVHWMGADGSNQYQSYFFNADLSKATTIALDWESTSLTFYVNGRQVVQYLAGGSVPIPKDAADGGENEAFGAGNVGPAGTSLTIQKMSYSVPTTTKASANTAAASTVTLSSATTGTANPTMNFMSASATTSDRSQATDGGAGSLSSALGDTTSPSASLHGMINAMKAGMNADLFQFGRGVPSRGAEHADQPTLSSLAGLMTDASAMPVLLTADN